MTNNGELDDNTLVLVLVGGFVALSGGLGVFWHSIVAWLLDHQVLVHSPLITVPGTGDAGLDLPRLAIAVAVLLVVFYAIAFSVHRNLRRKAS